MRLWEINGPSCSVLFPRDESGFSQPASLLEAEAASYIGKTSRLYLTAMIPQWGLRRISSSHLRAVASGFLELEVSNEDLALGFLLFLDGPMVTICACAYLKAPGAEPASDQLAIAESVRQDYSRAKEEGPMKIDPL